jgi:hypothetical protein
MVGLRRPGAAAAPPEVSYVHRDVGTFRRRVAGTLIAFQMPGMRHLILGVVSAVGLLSGCGSLADAPGVGGGGGDSVGLLIDAGDETADHDGGVDSDATAAGDDSDADGVDDSEDNCPDLGNVDQADDDDDGHGNACDCDAGDPLLAADLVVQNALAADTGLFAPAAGFAGASWAYQSGALRQNRLVNDGSDVAFLAGDVPLGDVMIELTAASTEIADFDTQDHRQVGILARAQSAAGSFSSVACAIEIVEGQTPTQKTSSLKLGGAPPALTTTVYQRSDRAALTPNEEFYMRMVLRDGTMTCTVLLDGTVKSTATATGLGAGTGRVGLLTRETKALFKTLRVCSYR